MALAEQSLQQVAKQQVLEAVETLQKAIAAAGQQFPGQAYEALGVLAQVLLAEGRTMASRGHLMLQVGLSGAKNPTPLNLLSRINASPSIPLLLKQDVNLVDAPEDALWKKSFNTAMEYAYRGAWRKCVDALAELAAQAGSWPAILRNQATLLAWLADDAAAIAALRGYAGSSGVPLDDAVEAEAVAQLLDREHHDQIDILTLRFPIRDVETLQARLFASTQTPRMPIDLSRLGSEEQPPPKGAFFILDRPVPASGLGITREQIPRVVGQAFLFGKQTDREALLEVVTYRTEEEAKVRQVLDAVAGDALITSQATEEVSGQVPAGDHTLSWNWRLPDDTPPAERMALMSAEMRNALLERWTKLPQQALGGQSPHTAAADPKYRTALLASILQLELSSTSSFQGVDFNELRRSLCLPEAGPVDPNPFQHGEVPLARLAHADVAKFSDDDLLINFDRAQHFRYSSALRRLAAEVVARPSLSSNEHQATAYGVLAQSEPDIEKAVGYLEQARKSAEAAGRSTAPWDITELSLRIAQGNISEADRLLHHIRGEHIREPGVAQALFQVLADAGIINPDGTPAVPADAAAGAAAPGLVMPGAGTASAAASGGGKIWTPGSEPSAPGKKSAIWTPGD